MAESLDYVTKNLPVIYLMDCTLNDCDLILKSVDQVLVELCFPGIRALSCFYFLHVLLSLFPLSILRLLVGCIHLVIFGILGISIEGIIPVWDTCKH